jgi:hypothetical protein
MQFNVNEFYSIVLNLLIHVRHVLSYVPIVCYSSVFMLCLLLWKGYTAYKHDVVLTYASVNMFS